MRLRRTLLRTTLAVAVLALGVAAWDVATYDREAWLADYARVKHDMAQGYANLDWMVAHRGLDLRALDATTTARISNAHSRVRALLALRDFVDAFGDPHLQLARGARPVSTSTQADASDVHAAATEPAAGADCVSAGYEEGDHDFGFPFAAMPGWRPVAGGDFPTGLIGDVGVLRIAQLGEHQYLAACNSVFRAGIGERTLQLAVRARQQRQLADAIGALRARGATRLLIDVAGNGGGSEWVSEVIALFTDRTLSRSDARVVDPACDRSAVWSGAKAPCDVFGAEAERATLQGTGPWRGPVWVLVDGGTASAAEDLVAWLQQNGVATVIGERTLGAGCGYVDGGTVTALHQAPIDVRMPNCARFLRDGANEVEGIAPDLPLPAGDDADRGRALGRLLAGQAVSLPGQ
jgi:hypothetical protein